jgi:hypothetical protein
MAVLERGVQQHAAFALWGEAEMRVVPFAVPAGLARLSICHPERVEGWESEGSRRLRRGTQFSPRVRPGRFSSPQPSVVSSPCHPERVEGWEGEGSRRLRCSTQFSLRVRPERFSSPQPSVVSSPCHPQRVEGWEGEGSRRLRCSTQFSLRVRPGRFSPPQPERSLAPPAHTPLLGMTSKSLQRSPLGGGQEPCR